MAANSFRGLGWFGGGVVVALGCYLVTSAVAAERAKLAHVQQLGVVLSVVVTLGKGRPTTFTSALELTRKLPGTRTTSKKHTPHRA